ARDAPCPGRAPHLQGRERSAAARIGRALVTRAAPVVCSLVRSRGLARRLGCSTESAIFRLFRFAMPGSAIDNERLGGQGKPSCAEVSPIIYRATREAGASTCREQRVIVRTFLPSLSRHSGRFMLRSHNLRLPTNCLLRR